MKIRRQKSKLVGVVLLIALLISAIILPSGVSAAERDFPANPQREFVLKAISFLRDNGSQQIDGINAHEELTLMLATDAGDGTKQLREETNWLLGVGGTDDVAIRVGLPPTGDIDDPAETDISTPDGFKKVKTLAQTLYHEWVHWRRFSRYDRDLMPALDHNWASCEPLWDEVEAYYREIKLKLEWKLARQNRLAQIPGYGPILGPPTPEQQAEAERLQREIANLEVQVSELVHVYLGAFRNAGGIQKRYEDDGNLLRDVFDLLGSNNQAKYDEVVARLGDISRIDPRETPQTIENKIAAKVNWYRLKKMIEWIRQLINELGGIIKLIVSDGNFLELRVPQGGLYTSTEVTITRVSDEYMAPWKNMHWQVLSPVYQIEAPTGTATNPARPSRVTLSYDKTVTPRGPIHIYRLRSKAIGRSTATDQPLWEALSGEVIDPEAGTISGETSDPFSLYVVMAPPSVPTGVNTYWLAALALLAMAMGLVVMKRAKFLRA